MSSPAITNGRGKKQNIVVLRLPSILLKRFAPPVLKEEPKSASSSVSSPAPATNDLPTLKVTESTDNVSESNSTAAPAQDGTTPTESTKKRKAPASGTKKSSGVIIDTLPKPRGKPGPKKKPRLEDGTGDSTLKPPISSNNHKLGPKANQGAINAGLRALDRSGKPCRKWNRGPFKVKSFTGVAWEIPSWKGGDKATMQNGDDTSDGKDVSMQSSSDMKPDSDVAMEDRNGGRPDPMEVTPAASSPAQPLGPLPIAA